MHFENWLRFRPYFKKKPWSNPTKRPGSRSTSLATIKSALTIQINGNRFPRYTRTHIAGILLYIFNGMFKVLSKFLLMTEPTDRTCLSITHSQSHKFTHRISSGFFPSIISKIKVIELTLFNKTIFVSYICSRLISFLFVTHSVTQSQV